MNRRNSTIMSLLMTRRGEEAALMGRIGRFARLLRISCSLWVSIL
jgi:hypothetical protein